MTFNINFLNAKRFVESLNGGRRLTCLLRLFFFVTWIPWFYRELVRICYTYYNS